MLKSMLGDKMVTEYEYNAQNQVKKVTKPDGSIESKSYDSAGRLQVYNNRTKSGRTFAAYIYTYDALGRITSEFEAITMSEYKMTYDSMGRLVTRTDGRYGTTEIYNTEEFTYDAAGNILTGESDTGDNYTYGYRDYNRMSRVNDGLVNTDEAGNTTFYYLDGTAIDLMYDERNRLVTLTHGYGSYRYDAENNRTYADGTKYVYDTSDGRNRVAESIDGEGNITIYGYGADGLVWSKSGDEYMVYHYDYRGSVTAVTDKDGNITDTLKYDAYGNISERAGSSKLLFTYNGQYGVQTDKSGYLYMRTRYYNPKFRRFMSADVIDGSIADSTTLNLYTYVNGNPISFVDPFGLSKDDRNNNSSNNPIYPLKPIGSNTSWPAPAINASAINNPWSELNYPGEVHQAVVNYLAKKYYLLPEQNSFVNKHNRYDLYSIATDSYWEVKPVSYITSDIRIDLMEKQMGRYDKDGVKRGVPLGYNEMIYNNYTVKIYSELPGKVYYSFGYDSENLLKEPVKVADPSLERITENAFSIDWDSVGENLLGGAVVVSGVIVIGLGAYQLLTTGDPSTLQQGWNTVIQSVG